jgi:Concanavalin A-like lectin/glucanases superfamily/Leucine Rich repeat
MTTTMHNRHDGAPFTFTAEAWACPRGAPDTLRYILMTGRYSLAVTRENRYSFSLTTAAGAELSLDGPNCSLGTFVHVAGTYDGTLAKLYVDGVLCCEVEVAAAVAKQTAELRAEKAAAEAEISCAELAAREACRVATDSQAAALFKTKEGKLKVARAATKLVERADVAAQLRTRMQQSGASPVPQTTSLSGSSSPVLPALAMPATTTATATATAASLATAAVQRQLYTAPPTKAEAKALARAEVRSELYVQNVRAIAEQFARRRHDLQDAERADREEAREQSNKPLRIGGACSSRRGRDGRNFWCGDLAHIAVYTQALSSDALRQHWLCGAVRSCAESDRLRAAAHARFEQALAFAPDDARTAAAYAASVVAQLQQSGSTADQHQQQQRVAAAVATCMRLSNVPALGAIVRDLPAGVTHAAAVATAVGFISGVSPAYFTEPGSQLPLAVLARVPVKFCMTGAAAPPQLVAAAAAVYRLVLRSGEESYCGLDLTWLPRCSNDAAVVAVAAAAEAAEDEALANRSVDVHGCSTLSDADACALLNGRRLATVLNLSSCSSISDATLAHAARVLSQLQALTLDGCPRISDLGLHPLLQKCPNMKVLGLSRCAAVSPEMLLRVPALCSLLKTVNLSHSPSVNDAVVAAVTKGCRRLSSLFLQYCVFVTDAGAQALAVEANAATLTALDLSGCARISDAGVSPIAELCTGLTYLNLKGVNRVTEAGVTAVTHALWGLQYLSLEDCYNVLDAAFVHDLASDGRRAVDDNMMTSLTHLSLRDCCRLTDVAIEQVTCHSLLLLSIVLVCVVIVVVLLVMLLCATDAAACTSSSAVLLLQLLLNVTGTLVTVVTAATDTSAY